MHDPSEEPVGLEPTEVRWRFGPFVLWETQRRLERDAETVRLGPRSFDLLLHLVRRAGEFLGKEELLSTVWAGVVVEEGSVRVHMSTLRKALGPPGDAEECREWISNVPLRGYRFNGRVQHQVGAPSSPLVMRHEMPSFTQPPVRLTDLVGRDADVQGVLAALEANRLITLVGTGGIGKTSVAIRVAERRRLESATGIAYVDLAPLISQDHVLGTLARALGAAADLPDTVQAITQRLAGRSMLLVVDNCEHVLEALAAPLSALLAALPGLQVLATSREALRITGEVVFRLSPLAVPDAERVTLAQALEWSSVRLLVERGQAAGAARFDDAQAPFLARISRQLDGIPLAIELVAARLGTQPARDLALRLDDHMRLSSAGNRAAQPRHRSLAAALDWSIALLNEEELRLFRRLSVFRGCFDTESALSVGVESDPDVAFDALSSLVSKSLVHFDGADAGMPYRLLDTTRSYAASLLQRSGERPALLRRHALFITDLMRTATAELPKLTEETWGDRYAHFLDDVRFALDVCLVQQPDAQLAASLVIASGSLWFHVSQVAEYRDLVVAALALVEKQPEPDVEAAGSLNTVLVSALLHTGGTEDALNAACDRALAGALAAKVAALELRARWGRCTHDMFRGEYASALQQSQTLLAFAQSLSEPGALNLAHRVCAMANHFCGHFTVSREHSNAALALSYDARRTHGTLVGPDTIVASQALLCRTLWIQGETDRALETASEAVSRAKTLGHSVSLCAALYGACAVALWSGDLDLSRRWVPLMMEEARRRGLLGWLRYAEWFSEGLRLATAEDPRIVVHEVARRVAAYDAPRKEMLMTFCPDWLDDQVVARASGSQALWCAAEAWRALGWRSERRGSPREAKDFYRRSIEIARQQGAIGWEARAVADLARLRA